jgi:hypothetical protein
MRVGQKQSLFGGIAVWSASALVLEIALTRLYSALYGYHLAFLAVSLSLFGLGVGGVLQYVVPSLVRPPALFRRLAYFAGAAASTMVAALLYLVNARALSLDAEHALLRAFVTYLVCALPFVFVGLVVAAGLRHAHRDAGRVYFADLLGASLGCLLALGALRLGPLKGILAAAILASAASVLFAVSRLSGPISSDVRAARPGPVLTFVLASVVLLLGDSVTPWLKLGSVKSAGVDKVEFQRWNEVGLVTVERPEKGMAWIRTDGSSSTAILDPKTSPPSHPDEMGYLLHREPGPVLVIGAGGGRDVRAALKAGQKDIDAVEVNRVIVDDVMRGRYQNFSGGLFDKPEVHVTIADGRSFVRESKRSYQTIVLSLVDTLAASSVGAFALAENGLYTAEAFADYLNRLSPSGTLVVNRWDSEFERLLSVAVAGLEIVGAEGGASKHLFACSSQRSTALVVKRAALTVQEIGLLRAHCKRNKFDEIFSPDDPHGEARSAIARQGGERAMAAFASSDWTAPTDDRPFFFYTTPAKGFGGALRDWKKMGEQNQGLFVLVCLLAASVVAAVAFLLGPLVVGRAPVLSAADRGARFRGLAYFAAIGTGFVAVELALVQPFTILLGQPAYALSVALLALLLAAGIGGALSARVSVLRAALSARRCAEAVVALVAIYAVALGPVLAKAGALPLAARVAVAVALLFPIGVFMGALGPLGVKLMASRDPDLVPWTIGLGGVFGVLATALGTLVAIECGFSVLLLVAGVSYLVAALASPPPGDRPEVESA